MSNMSNHTLRRHASMHPGSAPLPPPASAAPPSSAQQSPSSQDDPIRKISLEPEDEDMVQQPMDAEITVQRPPSVAAISRLQHQPHQPQQQQQLQSPRPYYPPPSFAVPPPADSKKVAPSSATIISSSSGSMAYAPPQPPTSPSSSQSPLHSHNRHQHHQHQHLMQQSQATQQPKQPTRRQSVAHDNITNNNTNNNNQRIAMFAQLAKEYVQRFCAEVYNCYTPQFHVNNATTTNQFDFHINKSMNPIRIQLHEEHGNDDDDDDNETTIQLTIQYPLSMEIIGTAILQQQNNVFVQSLLRLGSLIQFSNNHYILQSMISYHDDDSIEMIFEYDDFRDTMESLIDTAEFISGDNTTTM
eukprot:CAMPEP_0119565428 /NCGR_PEP_ID=MMETSP1352-20130426/29985_1 /TAXON_ID=265584 /ORGANISM="Stauroneis constricta, Strain CCMP1120" /LENGTH=356 /DNA_ID=CAMNT_0007614333 /DNA_START=493 /DNA_END=1560 /DNA_ORIENTATION=-